MAIPDNDAVTQLISDWQYKVKTLTTFKGQNTNTKIVDPQWYMGFVDAGVSFLDLVSITWSVFDGGATLLPNDDRFIEIRWKNFDYPLLRLSNNGSYGEFIGLPKIYNDVADADREVGDNAGRVRLNQNNNDTDGFLVCTWDKVGDWTGDTAPPA